MGERVTGYSFLVTGIVIMLIALIQVFLVFTNRMEPLQVFNISSENEGSSGSINSTVNLDNYLSNPQNLLDTEGLNNQGQSLSLPIPEIIPSEVLDKTLNLTTQFFLMTFLMGFGYKIASLGVGLVRPIKVKLNTGVVETVGGISQPKGIIK
ncbi:MAG: hypothetical protein Q8P26_00105 [Candidatus Levybacteria bacterium]|nr:hypothetical protein [Candidatus Levybacteria bacterium]MDZ4228068.1 hypothetical protein [Candidatus Levybacteria bacterium]